MNPVIQSELIVVKSGTSIKEAKEFMSERRIRHLPVVDQQNKIISMFSKHDYTDVDKFQNLPVDLFASSPVTSVPGDTPIRKIALLMLEKKISSVLLTDLDDNVIGIITTDDLLYQLSKMLTDEKPDIEFYKVDALLTAGQVVNGLSQIGI